MLTVGETSSYRLFAAINCGPMTFGTALQLLREARAQTATGVAAIVLGPKATKTQVASWANYLSKIENDRVAGVGLDRIRAIALALGFDRLSKFFAVIEELQQKGVADPLLAGKASDRTTLAAISTPGGERGASSTLRGADDIKREILFDLSRELLKLSRPPDGEQAAADRTREPKRRGGPRKNDRSDVG